MTIKEAQELIETWTAKNNVRNNELTNMALLTEEIGKLTRVMVRRFNDHANEPNFRYEVSDEIGDPPKKALHCEKCNAFYLV